MERLHAIVYGSEPNVDGKVTWSVGTLIELKRGSAITVVQASFGMSQYVSHALLAAPKPSIDRIGIGYRLCKRCTCAQRKAKIAYARARKTRMVSVGGIVRQSFFQNSQILRLLRTFHRAICQV